MSNSTLAAFLSKSKEKYISDVGARKGHDWTVVMGNEAGDLDSIASAVAYAWIQSEVNEKPTIPLIQMQRQNFKLRDENIYALSLAGLTPELPELLSQDDLSSTSPFPSNRFALVDHNRIVPRYLDNNEDAQVVAVIDHHDDEGLYKDTADPRVVRPAGSCASLVTKTFSSSQLPPELATLLLSAILIDTGGLKSGGKALSVDVEAAGLLASWSTLAPSLSTTSDRPLSENVPGGDLHNNPTVVALTTELLARKNAVSHLTTTDLLRRDYKQYDFTLGWTSPTVNVTAGLSSVPIGLSDWMPRQGFWGDIVSWMSTSTRELSILGILTSFHDESKLKKSGKPKHRREIVWVIREICISDIQVPGWPGTDELARRLWEGMEVNEELHLDAKSWKHFEVGDDFAIPPSLRAQAYHQGNATATRKAVAPILKSILEREDTKL